MLTKAEWDKMERLDKHFMILERVFRYPVKLIESGRKYVSTSDESGVLRQPINYTTDRNACSLMLDELRVNWLDKWVPFCVQFLLLLHNEGICLPNFEYGDRGFKDLFVYDAGGYMDALLRAKPDTICYCAVKVVEDAA